MKKFIVIAAVLSVPGSALAAEVGLGVSIKSSDSTIYVPINVSESFRIEPMLQYVNETSEDRLLPDTPYTIAASYDTTQWIVGAGLFGVTKLADSASVYYGGRIGYQSVKNEIAYTGSLPPGYTRPASSSDEYDGYLLAPTVGLEYHFSEHFSIGGEAALTYTSFDGDDSENENVSTSTNIIFRYMF